MGTVEKGLKWGLAGAGLWYLGIYLVLAVMRMQYPYHIGWTEGAHVDEVIRVLEGKALYTRPTAEYVPFIYMPVYFWVSALASKVLGVGFLPLRLVSFAASLGSMGIIFHWVSRETGRKFCGFLSACLFAAMFKISGASLDIGAVDSLCLFLLLSGMYVLRYAYSQKSHLSAGLILTAAFFTKQVVMIPFLLMSVYVLFVRPRKMAMFFGSAMIVGIAAALIMNRISDGWFVYHTFELPRRFSGFIMEDRIIRFWTEDLWKFLAVPCVVSLVYFLFPGKERAEERIFYGFLFVGSLLGSYMSRLHDGGSQNVLLPLYAAIAIVFGLAFNATPKLFLTGLYSLSIIAFVMLAYSPVRQIPGEDERLMGEKIVSVMKRFDGELYAPRYGYLPRLLGKKTYAHRSPISDLIRSDKAQGRELRKDIYRVIEERRFEAILCQADLFPDQIQKYYAPAEEIPLLRNKFWWPNADPVTLYLPRESAGSA